MAVLFHATLTDVNGLSGRVEFYVADAAAAAGAPAVVKALTNAKITQAYYSTPIDISGLAGNNAAAANLESVLAKMKISMFGPNPDSTADPNDTVIVSVPAPIGSFINGLTGDPTAADIVALRNLVRSNNGNAMTNVRRVYYARSR